MEVLLDVRGLRTQFHTRAGVVRAVDGVSWSVHKGETVALVGESGCGKSVSALSVMRLVSAPAGRIVDGEIVFKGRNLLSLSEEEMRKVRGREIGMIFQEPMTSLNPVLTIGRQLTETLEIHLGMTRPQAQARAVELLSLVGIPDGARRLRQFPHQFSGGMRQRIMIAMALSCDPALILADEPTTALDVTIQAQILELMKSVSRRLGVAILMITHNLGVVARYADRVNVMYAGKIVERATARALRQSAASLHARAAPLGAAPGRATPGPAAADTRPAPRPLPPAPGLLLRAPLRLRGGPLPRAGPTAGRGRRGAPLGLLARQGPPEPDPRRDRRAMTRPQAAR
jgi:ABC-type dipeptide/oligopeptide/nickel transport system ATPase component